MSDQHTYLIRLDGQVTGEEINASTPLWVDVIQSGEAGTLLSVCTDQSGLVGLIRHLHGIGFRLESVTRSPS